MRGDTRIAARPSLELRIDELVLHGFSRGDRRRIGEAVEHELTRLLAGSIGLQPWLASREVARVDGGVFEVASNARPEMIGVRVAQMVYEQLAQAPPSVCKKSTTQERDHTKRADGQFS
jgi:hypothetical protein